MGRCQNGFGGVGYPNTKKEYRTNLYGDENVLVGSTKGLVDD